MERNGKERIGQEWWGSEWRGVYYKMTRYDPVTLVEEEMNRLQPLLDELERRKKYEKVQSKRKKSINR